MEESNICFTSFKNLQKKEVVNCSNGERLGFICDAEIDMGCGEIKYFIVPVQKDPLSFRAQEWKKFSFDDISKVGDDIILIKCAYPAARKPQKRKKVL